MIKHKPKRCKGTGPAKGWHSCGQLTIHRYYGLCKAKCYPDWLLNSEPGKIKLLKAQIRATSPRTNLEQAQVLRKKNRSLEWLKINVRTICHNYIKQRDEGKPCISCGQSWHSDFQAGHFYKAELFSTLKYHEDNIHGQCPGCNTYKDGNVQEYAIRLEWRIGEKKLSELTDLSKLDKQARHKWNREELEKIRAYYQQKINELPKEK